MEQATQNIRKELKDYITENNIRSLIIGVSGGIDSALCCALAKFVSVESWIPLIGRSLPTETSTPEEIGRAQDIGLSFCTDFKEVPLTETYKNLDENIVSKNGLNTDKKGTKIRRGNIKARLRMIHLYDLAKRHNGIVLSTDNFTEYLLGFWTLHGDVGDYGMIQNLWKTEVYNIVEYLRDRYGEFEFPEEREILQQMLDADATDGLGISDTDLDQLLPSWEGQSRDGYREVDEWLISMFSDFDLKPTKENWNHPVVQRHRATNFKRDNPHNISRSDILSKGIDHYPWPEEK